MNCALETVDPDTIYVLRQRNGNAQQMPPLPPNNQNVSRARRSVTEWGSQDHLALKASGLYQTASVQDRVRQWQEYGASTAPDPDAVSIISIPRSQLSTTPEPKLSKRKPAQKEISNTQSVGKCADKAKDMSRIEDADQTRFSSTPRKRVVSDNRWKTNRSSKTELQSRSEEIAPKANLSTPRAGSPQIRDPKSLKKARAEREERRKLRVEAQRKDARHTAKNNDTGSKPEFTNSAQTDGSHHALYESGVADVLPSGRGGFASEFPGERVPESDAGPGTTSRYAEVLGRPPPSYQDAQLKSRKGSILNKTREALGLSDTISALPNRLPCIEAWLDDQPDSLVEDMQPMVRFEDGMHSQVATSLPAKQTSKMHTVDDPNHIWEAIGDHLEEVQVQSDVVKKKKGSPIVVDSQDSQSQNSLKRRGAKASRLKRHTLQHVSQKTGTSDVEKPSGEQNVTELQRVVSGYPTTGRARLPTIASIETIRDPTPVYENVGVGDDQHSELKIISNEDMMTVLSRHSLRKSNRRKRSIKISHQLHNNDPLKRILESLVEDEAKYSRELRTLVDGVVPVLLQCILSKSDAVAAAEFFTTPPNTSVSVSFSRPIIDMGIALERLKTLHNRIPLQNVDGLLTWCSKAHKAYSDYLKAWRLGFQDIVVNLAPLEGFDSEQNEVMARDGNGDIVNSKGEAVDIAYLMKRPLVNIRKLGRVLSNIEEELPDNAIAAKVAEDYRELTAAAKTKHQQEKGRLEDEAAAGIDATRCRDIRNMGPLVGAKIEKDRRVRARDCFNLTFFHSTGQRMDCKVELVLRDDHHSSADGGDLLICQIDETGRWLLFAPSALKMVSARKGESGCDLVIMLRGRAGIGQEWRELLALQADESEAVAEWLFMLGSNPLPPKLGRNPSILDRNVAQASIVVPQATDLTPSVLQRVPSIETIDIPIGEPSILGLLTVDREHQTLYDAPSVVDPPIIKASSKLSMGGGLQHKPLPERLQAQASSLSRRSIPPSIYSSDKSTISGHSAGSTSIFAPSSMTPMSRPRVHFASETVLDSKSSHDRTQSSRYGPQVLPSLVQSSTLSEEKLAVIVPDKGAAVTTKARAKPDTQDLQLSDRAEGDCSSNATNVTRPTSKHNLSLTSDEPLPNIPKTKKTSSSVPLTDAIRETWSSISTFGRRSADLSQLPADKRKAEKPDDLPLHPTSTSSPDSQRDVSPPGQIEQDSPPPPPPPQHKHAPVLTARSRNVPTLGPSETQKKLDRESGRTFYSPLRRQYMPSSASASDNSESDASFSSDDDSQTSEEPQSDCLAQQLPKGMPQSKHMLHAFDGIHRPALTAGTRTLAPSDSASQGPYRRVPSSAEQPNIVKKRAVAMICSWSDKGVWEPLLDEYCSIVISPGLMEAFMMNEAHGEGLENKQQPLAAFELTPIVPLRRPTGLDINIRSPPTPSSKVQTSSNIMFRSHSAVECEALYQMINWARCNNPTYIQLQRSRPKTQPPVTFNTQQASRPRSWFSFGPGVKRQNSYRVGNIPPSSIGESLATANTTSSAMSALRRLTQSSAFNVNRSSVRRRSFFGTGGSIYSSSNDTGLDSGKSTPPPSQLGLIPGKDGPKVPPTSAAALDGGGMVHNMKVRLQIRQAQGWATIGLSRLTILPAVKHNEESPEPSRPGSAGSICERTEVEPQRIFRVPGSEEPPQRQYRLPSASHTPHRIHGGGREKRVVVTLDKDPSRVFLDAVLGESCFEKISHLGIAIQVWRADDEVRSRGGVGLGQNTKYLLQFFNAKECAWVFDLVGRYRYSAVTGS